MEANDSTRRYPRAHVTNPLSARRARVIVALSSKKLREILRARARSRGRDPSVSRRVQKFRAVFAREADERRASRDENAFSTCTPKPDAAATAKSDCTLGCARKTHVDARFLLVYTHMCTYVASRTRRSVYFCQF